MVFSAKVGDAAAQDIEIAEGSHVYSTEGDSFTEWGSLSSAQQKQLIEVNAFLDNAFVQARSMIALVGLKAGSNEVVTESLKAVGVMA